MMNRFEHFSISIFNIGHYWNILASEEMKEHGLRGGYALYLIILYNSKEDLTAAKLSDICHRDKADVSRAIAAFQKKGFLEPYGESRYRAPLKLTPEGRKIAGQINDKATSVISAVSEGMTDEMRNHMYDSLDLIAGNMKRIIEKRLSS